MSDLSETAAVLDMFDRDLRSHETNDSARFKQLQEAAGQQAAKSVHLENLVTLLHDQMIEGFRKLGAELEDTRRGKNGR